MTTFVIAAIVGIVIGLFSGMLGIGGGTVMVPVFRLAFGMSPLGATATSLFTIIPTSVTGAVTHLRGKTCVPKLGLALGIGGACTSPIGVWLAQISPGWLVMMAAALVIGYSAFTMFRKALKAPRTERSQIAQGHSEATVVAQGAKDPNANAAPAEIPNEPSIQLDARGIVKAVLIGALAGVASGYVGLGGGFLMVPLMLSFMNMPMKLTSGTSLIAVMILAMPATITQCILGNVDYLAGIAVACGSIPGALLGARLMRRIPERNLRFTFAGFLLVASALLVVKETGLIG